MCLRTVSSDPVGAASRTKGAVAERAVAAYMRDHGTPDARRYLAGDGHQPGDIDALPGVAIEVKHQAVYDIPAWLRQTVAQADGWRVPLLVVHPRGVTDVGDWWAITRFADALKLLHTTT